MGIQGKRMRKQNVLNLNYFIVEILISWVLNDNKGKGLRFKYFVFHSLLFDGNSREKKEKTKFFESDYFIVEILISGS
jgi:hypothetical protein